jgi:myo-inositol 2-dehydrogenase / D-chiro-inositol 1-dehydrogenase
MIHDFDTARWLLGEEPTEVYATASTHLGSVLNPDGEADAGTATLKTASGAVCQIIVSRRAVYGYDQRIEVFGSEGMIQSENQAQSHVRVFGKDAVTSDPLKHFFTDRYADAYVREIDVFLDAIEGKPVSFPNLQDGREALALSMDALKSAQSGQPVVFKPGGGLK